jgi:hypothetical protein
MLREGGLFTTTTGMSSSVFVCFVEMKARLCAVASDVVNEQWKIEVGVMTRTTLL